LSLLAETKAISIPEKNAEHKSVIMMTIEVVIVCQDPFKIFL
jgi:hypothetical protein